ncbi:MAG: signal peptidase I [Planctomycetes bacterium]|nr:signal peptidase I [Planctomycetota bacterium]
MAPTLFGIHAWATCPNCDTEFNFGLQSDTDTGKLSVPFQEMTVYLGKCPKCGLPNHRLFADSVAGQTAVLTCDSETCQFRWKAELKDFSRSSVHRRELTLECPICQLRFRELLEQSNHTGGHKILVNKFAYRLGPPRRWDVIVFQMNEEKNYIKRLLGLPGEKISFRGGDLYVQGPGEEKPHLERKLDRPDVQKALWTKISDTKVRERGYNPEPAWKEVFEKDSGLEGKDLPARINSQWWKWLPEAQRPDANRWAVNVLQPPGRIAALKFNRRCVDFYNYNLFHPDSRSVAFHQVGDKKVAFTVRPSMGSGWIGGEIRDGDFTFQLRIPVGKPDPARPATLRRLPAEKDMSRYNPRREPPAEWKGLQAAAEVALPILSPSQVEFENVDDRIAVRLNGREAMAIEYESGSPELKPDDHYLMLLASDVTADFESVEVCRDVYYTQITSNVLPEVYEARMYDPSTHTYHVGSAAAAGANEYFPCGDNSPNSLDGRFWGTVPERNLMGKALLVFWPAWPTNWQPQFIR